MNLRNLFQSQEPPNLPRPTLTTHLKGTRHPLESAPLTFPLVTNPPHCDSIPEALLQHPALLQALQQQPLTLLPSALPHLKCSRGLNPRKREARDNPHRITQSLLSLVSLRKNLYSCPAALDEMCAVAVI